MTIRSLFNIILKILGIFFIKDILEVIPQLFSVLIYVTKPGGLQDGIWTMVLSFASLAVYFLVSFYLIFRSEQIIDALKLDRDFNEEPIPLNIHRSTILSISIIVIGGYIIANEIPDLCRQLFILYQQNHMSHGQADPKVSYAVFAVIKIIVGCILIGNQKSIVHFIEYKRK
ncbi:MAG: hypothetical protein ABJB86_14340 [Bacteroidota bacterium]